MSDDRWVPVPDRVRHGSVSPIHTREQLDQATAAVRYRSAYR